MAYMSTNSGNLPFTVDANGNVIFNDSGANVDFTVESDSNDDVFQIDGAGNGNVKMYQVEVENYINLKNAYGDSWIVRAFGGGDRPFEITSSTANRGFNFAANVGGGGTTPVLAIDGSNGNVELHTGAAFRNTRLLTVSVSDSTTLTEAAHAGRYNICAGNVTLPATSSAGEHYAILNTTGGNITIGRNGNNINGAGSDFTLATYKAATCIAIGSNNWMVVG